MRLQNNDCFRRKCQAFSTLHSALCWAVALGTAVRVGPIQSRTERGEAHFSHIAPKQNAFYFSDDATYSLSNLRTRTSRVVLQVALSTS